MIKMREDEKNEGIDIDEESICRRVLGPEKYGYTPGLGPTPRKSKTDEVPMDPPREDYKQLFENLSTKFQEFQEDTTNKYDALKKMILSITNQSQNSPLNIGFVESPPPSTPLSAQSVSDLTICTIIFILIIFWFIIL